MPPPPILQPKTKWRQTKCSLPGENTHKIPYPFGWGVGRWHLQVAFILSEGYFAITPFHSPFISAFYFGMALSCKRNWWFCTFFKLSYKTIALSSYFCSIISYLSLPSEHFLPVLFSSSKALWKSIYYTVISILLFLMTGLIKHNHGLNRRTFCYANYWTLSFFN